MSELFFRQTPKTIIDAIEYRQNHSIDRSEWLGRTPWCKMTSCAEIQDPIDLTKWDSNIRKEWILYGSKATDDGTKLILTTENVYDVNDNKPIPGITSVEVRNKGALGASREGIIKFKANSLEQLDILSKLYMSYGIRIVIEWGWSIDPVKLTDTVNGINMFSSKITDEQSLNDAIRQNVMDNNGAYDGMVGMVCNFNWELQPDGTFNCTTTIISSADMFLGLDIHSKTHFDVNNKDEVENLTSRFDKINQQIGGERYAHPKKTYSTTKGTIAAYETLTPMIVEATPNTPIYYEYWDFSKINNANPVVVGFRAPNYVPYKSDNSINTTNENLSTNEFKYITLGHLEDIITEELSYISSDKKQSNPVDNWKNALIKVFSANIVVPNYKYLCSADPAICLLPGQQYNINGDVFTNNSDNYLDTLGITMYKFATDDTFKYGTVRNILVNLDFIIATYKETKILDEFFSKLFVGISEACGGVWDLKIHVDGENKSNILQIVDGNSVGTVDNKIEEINEPKLKFKLYNINSICKFASLNTRVDNNIKGHIMFSTGNRNKRCDNHSESSIPFKIYGTSVRDVFNKEIIPITPYVDAYAPPDYIIKDHNDAQATYNQQTANFKTKFAEAKNSLMNSYEEGKSNEFKSLLNKYVTDYCKAGYDFDVNDYKVSVPLMLPLNISLTMDGTGGLMWGQVITIDYLPDFITKNKGFYGFMISNVTQIIDKNSWDTRVDTIMNVRNVVEQTNQNVIQSLPYVYQQTTDKLFYEDIVPNGIKTEFIAKVKEIATNLGANPNWLMGVMMLESSLTNIGNHFDGSFGLISFRNSSVPIGYTKSEILGMNAIQQLDVVESYLSKYKPYRRYTDVVLAVTTPAYKNDSDSTIVGSYYTKSTSQVYKIWKSNPKWDSIKQDKIITVGEIRYYYISKLRTAYQQQSLLNEPVNVMPS